MAAHVDIGPCGERVNEEGSSAKGLFVNPLGVGIEVLSFRRGRLRSMRLGVLGIMGRPECRHREQRQGSRSLKNGPRDKPGRGPALHELAKWAELGGGAAAYVQLEADDRP